MSDLYRINLYAADAHDYDTGESGPLARMIGDGVLVPVESLTPRLQAIADAWSTPTDKGGDNEWEQEIVSNEKPALGALLAALEGTNDE